MTRCKTRVRYCVRPCYLFRRTNKGFHPSQDQRDLTQIRSSLKGRKVAYYRFLLAVALASFPMQKPFTVTIYYLTSPQPGHLNRLRILVLLRRLIWFQVMGRLIKSYFATSNSIDVKTIYHISVMPCLDKKAEARRFQFYDDGRDIRDVDLVFTTGLCYCSLLTEC